MMENKSAAPSLLIAYTENLEKLPPHVYQQYIAKLPLPHREQILRYKFWQDAQRCLFGKLLLQWGLRELDVSLTLQDVKYTQYQRPYFEGGHIDFNISHSGALVVCAIAAHIRVGIDIEEVKPIEVTDFRDHFTKAEMDSIGNRTDGYVDFFHLWTKKEAVLKANGKGLGTPPKDILTGNDAAFVEGQQWFLTEIDFSSNYRCHLSTDIKPTLPISIRKYAFR